VLLHLEQSNLFLQSLDNERYWYRYHHLFADLLRVKLRHTHSAQMAVLHCRASQWFEKNMMIAEAVSHARAGNDFEQVMHLVKGNAFSMLDSGELATLIGWLDSIPQDLINKQPWMCIFYAWALAFTDQLNRAEEYLLKAESALLDYSESDDPHFKQEHILGYIAAIRVLISKNMGEMSRAVEFANEALKYLPDQDYKTRCYVAQTLGGAFLFVGDLEAASKALQVAIEASHKIEDVNRTVHVICDLAGLQWMLGQLRASEASCREALHLAESGINGEKHSSGAGIAHARLSRILLERNDAESALRHVERGLALSQRRGQADILFFCLVTLAEIQISNKDAQGAVATLQKAKPKHGSGAAWHAALIDQFETEALFSQGDLAAAEHWLQKLNWKNGDEIPEEQANAFEFVARILIAKHEYAAALNLLDYLLIQEQAKGVKAFVLFFLISQAIAWQYQGDMDQALAALDQALTQAESEGYIRTFTDRGAPMRSLLQKAVERGVHVQYANRLLAVLNNAPDTAISSIKQDMSKPGEPFSERELEVLKLLGANLSAPEIAATLIISINTVRTHIKSLYRKLNAHSRHEAIMQARDLRLL
jgi:LuxR family maltose regulon positive regulatory protein